MTHPDRRQFLRSVATATGATAALTSFPPVIAKALSIAPNTRTGTIQDVEHIVILTQENRSFDHYFGSLNGVRGFADRFPLPVPDAPGIVGKNVWLQPNETAGATPPVIAPFRLDTNQNFALMRVEGTPHTWTDAQAAWNGGLMNAWTRAKHNHSMAYYGTSDLPFQVALANAFTLCDAYHCGSQTGTNTNRLFLFTGTNDPLGLGGGPATYNDYDWVEADPGHIGGYFWTTYPERLQAAGITWQVYENMDDQFTDNPLAGFRTFRDAWYQKPGYSQALLDRGMSTRDLDLLKADVLADKLPQVSWIVATADGSEHPGPSSPAQGADYTSRVLDALTANPDVWAKTVFIVNFDENDGFFDHVPPPAPPSYLAWNADPALATKAGASTVDTTGEYHEIILPYHSGPAEQALLHHPYGFGPRVPMVVISPWSRGGWVNSQVFDHTSVIRFIEARFGVMEPNISAWRRAVSGDLQSALNFADPDDSEFFSKLPQTLALANQARALPGRTTPPPPANLTLPVQAAGVRPARALPYVLQVSSRVVRDTQRHTGGIELAFANRGGVGAVFHVVDRLQLTAQPRRYTVEAGKRIVGSWLPAASGAYDLWVLGPNGFHRHFTGNVQTELAAGHAQPELQLGYEPRLGDLVVKLVNRGDAACVASIVANRYVDATPVKITLAARSEQLWRKALGASANWYDFSVTVDGLAGYSRRFAGHMENGAPSVSDPAMDGPALIDQFKVG